MIKNTPFIITLLFVAIFFCSVNISAQNTSIQAIDSLSLKLNQEKNQEKKLAILNEIVATAFQSDLNLAKFYAKKGILRGEAYIFRKAYRGT